MEVTSRGCGAVAALALVCAAPTRDARAQEMGQAPVGETPVQAPVGEPSADDPMLAPPPPAPGEVASWDAALALIRTRSPEYLTSYEAVRRAAAQKETALAAVLPSIDGQGTYTHELLRPLSFALGGATIVTPPRDAWTLGAAASWPIINPRGIYGVGTADKNIDVANLTFEDSRRQVAAEVVDAILATLAAARVADLNRVGLRAALERLRLTQARLQFGQGTELDVDRAEQDIAAARSPLISGDEALRQAREGLGVALGSPVPLAAPPSLDFEGFQAAVARTCRLNDDIERRPDVAAARARVDLGERAVRDAELQFSPSLAATSQVTYSTAPILAPATTWSVGGVLTVPFYDGGVRYGALRDSQAALEQARQALVRTRLTALVASSQALRAVGVEQASRDVARRQRDLAAAIDRRTRDGYSHGLGTSLDLVISAQALRQAEIQLALLDFQVEEARANSVLTNAECVY
jgi:multidrug efflux system outer membrane protein